MTNEERIHEKRVLESISKVLRGKEDKKVELPKEMTPAIAQVLGKPNFTCAFTAQALRNRGWKIEHRAEDEQAAVLFFLLPFAIEHGDNWRQEAEAFLRTMPWKGSKEV